MPDSRTSNTRSGLAGSVLYFAKKHRDDVVAGPWGDLRLRCWRYDEMQLISTLLRIHNYTPLVALIARDCHGWVPMISASLRLVHPTPIVETG